MIHIVNGALMEHITISRAAILAAVLGGAFAWEVIKAVAHFIFYRVRKWRRDRYHRSPEYLAQVAAKDAAHKAFLEECRRQMRESDHCRFEEMAAEIGDM